MKEWRISNGHEDANVSGKEQSKLEKLTFKRGAGLTANREKKMPTSRQR